MLTTDKPEKAERHRGVASALFALSVLSALSCARIEPPPGGPPDTRAPTVASVFPDTMADVPGFDGEVAFTFSELVSEGGQPSEGFGTGDLERLILLSPTEKYPDVRWRRNRITVRPREGWRDGTVYRVELLPGVSDIRNNRSNAGASVTFTTGAPKPDYTLRGRIYDWTTSQPARGALIEAVLEPDSLVYRSASDSSGGFAFGPLPRGEDLVYAVVDQNRDRKRGSREIFDSVRVRDDSGEVPELWMFQRDTTPPRLQPPTVLDSISIALPFSQKLDPYQKVDSSMVVVRMLPDSLQVPVLSLLFPAAHDSLYRAAAAMRPDLVGMVDSLKARADTAGRPAPREGARTPGAPSDLRAQPRLSRPPLVDRLSVRLGQPVKSGASYTVLVRGVKNISGVATDSTRAGFKVPERLKPTASDSLRTLRRQIDSAYTRGDTALVDSLRKLLPDSLQRMPIDSLLRPPPDTLKAPRQVPKK
jgi:hypothetical protein